MAKKYHINPDTGDVDICKAKFKCKFSENGVSPKHYSSIADAIIDSEKNMAEEHGGSFGKILTNKKPKPKKSKKDRKNKFGKAVSESIQDTGYVLSEFGFTMSGGVEEMKDTLADTFLTEEQNRKRDKRIADKDYKKYLKEEAAKERKWKKEQEENKK